MIIIHIYLVYYCNEISLLQDVVDQTSFEYIFTYALNIEIHISFINISINLCVSSFHKIAIHLKVHNFVRIIFLVLLLLQSKGKDENI